MTSPKILYILECRHVWPGSTGIEEMECLNCNERKRIVDVHTFEWRVICLTCSYRPWCGLSRKLAEYHANGHAKKRSQHNVQVRYMENPIGLKIQKLLREGNNASSTSRNT